MSISSVFQQNDNAAYRQIPKPRPIIPHPTNLARSVGRQKKFFQEILPNARRRSGKTAGACVQINGEWSCGKTLVLCFIATERFEEEELTGVANFPIKVPGYEFLNDDFVRNDHDTGDKLYGFDALTEVYEKALMIDELQRYADSYMSKSQSNLFISNIIADMGKQGCDLYYTNQHYNAAPTRVRVNVSFIVYPQLDETTGWVHVYLFHSITKFLFMDPFWYFGFYGPDYWNNYDTKYKVEDYVPRFRTEPFIKNFLNWCAFRRITKKDIREMKTKKLRDTIKLWDATAGADLNASEISIVMTDMEYQKLWSGA